MLAPVAFWLARVASHRLTLPHVGRGDLQRFRGAGDTAIGFYWFRLPRISSHCLPLPSIASHWLALPQVAFLLAPVTSHRLPLPPRGSHGLPLFILFAMDSQRFRGSSATAILSHWLPMAPIGYDCLAWAPIASYCPSCPFVDSGLMLTVKKIISGTPEMTWFSGSSASAIGSHCLPLAPIGSDYLPLAPTASYCPSCPFGDSGPHLNS